MITTREIRRVASRRGARRSAHTGKSPASAVRDRAPRAFATPSPLTKSTRSRSRAQILSRREMGLFGNKPVCESYEFSSLKAYEPHSLVPLFVPGLVIFVVATLARLATFALVLKPLSEAACPGADLAKQQRKFREASWRACLYAVACGYAVKIMLLDNEYFSQWMADSNLFWAGWPQQEAASDVSREAATRFGSTRQILRSSQATIRHRPL